MSSTYNTLFVIDTTSALSLEKPSSGEIYVGNYVWMMDDNPNDTQGQGGKELTCNCKPQDIILWRGTSINQDDTVNITDFTVSTPNPPVEVTKEGNHFRGYVEKQGSETYQIHFMINSDASRKYYWDPYINVT
jgi:hypothetical protein